MVQRRVSKKGFLKCLLDIDLLRIKAKKRVEPLSIKAFSSFEQKIATTLTW